VPDGFAAPTHGSGADVDVLTGPGLPDSSTTVSFGGNPIIMEARVGLIFYGSAWLDLSMSPNSSDVEVAVAKIFASPYLSELIAYDCTDAYGGTDWNLVVINDPPNPFSPDDAGDVVGDLIDNYYSNISNKPNLYSVFLPPGVSITESGLSGVHSNDGDTYYLWQMYGSLDAITATFSHELVEAMTDPDGDGWQVDPRDDSDWHEIADICQKQTRFVNGVAVAAYFSRSRGACIVPKPDPPPPPPPKLPNGDYQITCATFFQHHYTQYIGIIGGVWKNKSWSMGIEHAIERIQNEELTFYTLEDGARAEVLIGHSLTSAFLTTAADDTQKNNLDEIAMQNSCEELPGFVLWD
jgi:hypothetical protein